MPVETGLGRGQVRGGLLLDDAVPARVGGLELHRGPRDDADRVPARADRHGTADAPHPRQQRRGVVEADHERLLVVP
ncbi:hypothetical protein AAGT00_16590 [Streptomyces cavourensis]